MFGRLQAGDGAATTGEDGACGRAATHPRRHQYGELLLRSTVLMGSLYRGKKITCPGARDKLNFRQDKHIFSPNVRRASKKFSASLFFLEYSVSDKTFRTSYLATGRVKILIFLPEGQVKILRFFYPCFKWLINSYIKLYFNQSIGLEVIELCLEMFFLNERPFHIHFLCPFLTRKYLNDGTDKTDQCTLPIPHPRQH